MKKRLRKWIDHLASAGSLPSDTSDQRLRKAILVFLASIYCIAGIIWGISYLALRLPLSGIIPLAYSFISALSLVYFFWTKRYEVFRFSQLSLILLLPFLLQYSLGGFVASSTVMIWAILSPVGALMFAGTTRALPWFLAYLVLMVVLGLLDPKLAQEPASIPSVFKVVFFIMNLGGVSTIFYVLLQYFVRERELAMAVLDKEHRRVVDEKDRLDKIKRVMANFVPETAKSIIEKDPEKGPLDKYVQDATVLFLDIEGFTALLQKYSTERINHVIESYFSIFYDLIQKNGGDVNEMAGDGMMVIFLEPDSGEVYLGSTKMKGSGGDRWTFTASGPVTIVAARLSDYAKGGQILIGEETVRRIGNEFPLKHLGKVQLKNFRDPVEVSQVTTH
jgi:guanylate cyclase